jgi:hypothetical protein
MLLAIWAHVSGKSSGASFGASPRKRSIFGIAHSSVDSQLKLTSGKLVRYFVGPGGFADKKD